MPLSKNAKLGAAIALIAVVSVPLVIVAIIYWTPSDPKGTPFVSGEIRFFGDTIATNISVTYDEITGDMTGSHFVNQSYTYVNAFGTSKTSNYTGVTLEDLITYAEVDYGAATAFQFWGIDGWRSPAIDIGLWQQYVDVISIVFAENGVLIPEKDGPFISIVNHSIMDPKASSRFRVKNLAGIQFLSYPVWNITIFGNVEKNSTIYYSELIHPWGPAGSGGLVKVNAQINYSNSLRDYTGISALDIMDYSGIKNTSIINDIRFIGADLWTTQNVSYSWVLNNENDVLVVYARDSVLLDPETDGYLNSVVDYSLTYPTGSGQYRAKYLLYIEILTED